LFLLFTNLQLNLTIKVTFGMGSGWLCICGTGVQYFTMETANLVSPSGG